MVTIIHVGTVQVYCYFLSPKRSLVYPSFPGGITHYPGWCGFIDSSKFKLQCMHGLSLVCMAQHHSVCGSMSMAGKFNLIIATGLDSKSFASCQLCADPVRSVAFY